LVNRLCDLCAVARLLAAGLVLERGDGGFGLLPPCLRRFCMFRRVAGIGGCALVGSGAAKSDLRCGILLN
jgi:hypothetical protein